MKFFAKLGLNSRVVGHTHIRDIDAPTEEVGIAYLNKLHSYPFWKEFKKDGSIRKNSAGKGYTYDEDRDAFIPKQPFNSWVLNEDTCRWEAPSARPDDDKFYDWNESTKSWDELIKINGADT